LEHEALLLWCKKQHETLIPPAEGDSTWDPIAAVSKLFRKEFARADPEKVRKLKTLKRRPGETCRMLKARLERLAEKTGLDNAHENAVCFVKALPAELRKQVKLVLYVKSDAGHYTLEQAFEVAEKIDLATAYAEEMDNGEDDETTPLARAKRYANIEGSERARMTVAAASSAGKPCYRCGEPDHQ
jgi:hypothetical protein